VFRVVSAEAYSKEGLNPSRVIMDELHAHKNREIFDVFSLAMGNRGKIGQLVAITTAGVKTDSTGQDSVCYSLYNYGKRVATGEVVDPAFFMAWWEAPEGADHRDPENWAIANPGFDDLVSREDFESAVRRTPEAQFRTKRMNQWVSTKEAWLPAGAWDELAEDFELLPTDSYFLGFDGSWNNDSTSLVAVIMPREEGDVFRAMRVASWEKNFAIDDDSWIVDKNDVTNTVMKFYDEHPNCVEMPCDPSYWEDQMWIWQEYGIPVVEYRNSPNRTIPATSKLYEAIMAKKLKHNGDAALARHIDNCVLKMDSGRGARITKDFRNPKLKVDNAIALMMAYDRASTRIEEQVIPEFFM
jgi:phage terminase large subunit-like protein